MINNFGDLLVLSNLGWIFFLFVCTLPGLVGLFYVGSNLWDFLHQKKAN